MKKSRILITTKLEVRKETIGRLTALSLDRLRNVAGGSHADVCENGPTTKCGTH